MLKGIKSLGGGWGRDEYLCVIALMQINELTHSGKGEEEEEKENHVENSDSKSEPRK